ncbi:MAG: deoxyribodipyrimidine photo-lyase [Lentimicrobiaceae bacterium]|nr:deoxyribodipyrimidine photo-lyase [Lentimicrobiaceae bacterium]MCB9023360.1 deoxyribodipyrimidine photo-lyase [Lentimicrobiaceae bacterium]
MNQEVNIFWFRRDLRLHDNHGLFEALNSGVKVLPVFIFDINILNKLKKDDRRVGFIFKRLNELNSELSKFKSGISVFYGNPTDIFSELITTFHVQNVFTNRDYEPYAVIRDKAVETLLSKSGVGFRTYKDQVLFEPGEILKPDGKPYTVFTPFSKRWMEKLKHKGVESYHSASMLHLLHAEIISEISSLEQLGFISSKSDFKQASLSEPLIRAYAEKRNIPGMDATSRLSVHLRFGTISVRDVIKAGQEWSPVWLNELIWREFFMHILAFFPNVVNHEFKPQYQHIQWLNDESQFQRWCEGRTGYPLVDAGMRELLQTGFMHNRVRMVVAGFLTKHLLIDWRWGEAWFAEKLLDYELSSNNGNWQWAAGTGCDAAPYFRIFNPVEQARKFDPDSIYIKRWLPEFGSKLYPEPIIDHSEARIRCLNTYKRALNDAYSQN